VTVQSINPHHGNLLLAALSQEDFELLTPHLRMARMVKTEPIFARGLPASHVWFPHEGVISIVAADADGGTIEVATVGREGMTGISLVLGSETMANEAMVQVPGFASRIETAAFRAAVERAPSLRWKLLRYVLAVMTQVSQNTACNQLHVVNTRCARWLLMTHDRVSGDSFELTHEYLAMMLGVTRPSVSAAAAALKRAGLINYSRGAITVVDRGGLEAMSCECYRIVEDEFDRLRGHD
jgi:CRP-like cAMP-binding protein